MLRARAAAAGVATLALLGALSPGFAVWKPATQISAPLSMARVGSSIVKVDGAGTATAVNYSLGTVLVPLTGYIDLVNTSTIPGTLSMNVTVGSLVAGTTVTQCSLPWSTTANTCPGTTTLIASSALLSLPVFPYAWTTITPAGGHVYLQVSISGLLVGISIDLTPIAVRVPGDRTGA